MTPADHIQIAEDCFDKAVRLEQIIHIASMCYDESFSDEAEEALTFEADEIEQDTGIKTPDPDRETFEDWFLEMRQKLNVGFFIKAATPVPRFYQKNQYDTSGWGHYATRWFYVDTSEDVFPKIHAWIDKYLEEQSKNQGY